jgi:hypothetical protein
MKKVLEIESTEDLIAKGYHLHHTATRRGYTCVACRGKRAFPYKGRFGEGYIVAMGPARLGFKYSTNYEFIAYYVK